MKEKMKLGRYLYKSGIVSEEKYLAADKEAAKEVQRKALGALRKGDIPQYVTLKKKLPYYLREQI
jgi:hypothetical protein